MVTEEVWRELDRNAGRLSARSTRRLIRVGLVILALVAALIPSWLAGLLTARLSWANEGGFLASIDPGAVSQAIHIRNDGWTDAVLLGAGRSEPGLTLTGASVTFPLTVRARESTSFALAYHVDCAVVDQNADQPWPVPVRVRRWWGAQTVYITLPYQTDPDATGGSFYSGLRAPHDLEWQHWLVKQVCRQ